MTAVTTAIPVPTNHLTRQSSRAVQTRIQRFVGHVVAVVGVAADGTRDDFGLIARSTPQPSTLGLTSSVSNMLAAYHGYGLTGQRRVGAVERRGLPRASLSLRGGS